jgi:hypothetical protein
MQELLTQTEHFLGHHKLKRIGAVFLRFVDGSNRIAGGRLKICEAFGFVLLLMGHIRQ